MSPKENPSWGGSRPNAGAKKTLGSDSRKISVAMRADQIQSLDQFEGGRSHAVREAVDIAVRYKWRTDAWESVAIKMATMVHDSDDHRPDSTWRECGHPECVSVRDMMLEASRTNGPPELKS